MGETHARLARQSDEATPRLLVLCFSIVAGIAFVALLSFELPADSWWASVLTDRSSLKLVYPFTIHNVMWILFFIGLGELLIRLLNASHDMSQVSRQMLPEDDETMLRAQDVAPICCEGQADNAPPRGIPAEADCARDLAVPVEPVHRPGQ